MKNHMNKKRIVLIIIIILALIMISEILFSKQFKIVPTDFILNLFIGFALILFFNFTLPVKAATMIRWFVLFINVSGVIILTSFCVNKKIDTIFVTDFYIGMTLGYFLTEYITYTKSKD